MLVVGGCALGDSRDNSSASLDLLRLRRRWWLRWCIIQISVAEFTHGVLRAAFVVRLGLLHHVNTLSLCRALLLEEAFEGTLVVLGEAAAVPLQLLVLLTPLEAKFVVRRPGVPLFPAVVAPTELGDEGIKRPSTR